MVYRLILLIEKNMELYDWFEAYLSDIKQRVIMNKYQSNEKR